MYSVHWVKTVYTYLFLEKRRAGEKGEEREKRRGGRQNILC